MPRLHAEALVFCLAWAALAVAGAYFSGLWTGIALSLGLMTLIMPLSLLVISRTENFTLERNLRWGILVLAAFLLFLAVRG